MITKHALLLGATMSVLAAAPAAAQTGAWTGAYVGVQVGYLWGDVDHSYSVPVPSGVSSLEGVVAGGHVGWQHQAAGGLVFGIEADGEWSTADGAYDDTTGATSAGAAELNWQASARARIGYASDNVLVYATGGGAFGDFDFVGGPSPSCVCGPLSGYSSTEIGWTVGAGVATKVGERVSAGLEYRYTDYGSETGETPAFPGEFMTVETATHGVRVRLGMHF